MKKIALLSSLCTLSLWADVYATFESQAYREASLGMNASGIVKNVSVQNGDHVKKVEAYADKVDRGRI